MLNNRNGSKRRFHNWRNRGYNHKQLASYIGPCKLYTLDARHWAVGQAPFIVCFSVGSIGFKEDYIPCFLNVNFCDISFLSFIICIEFKSYLLWESNAKLGSDAEIQFRITWRTGEEHAWSCLSFYVGVAHCKIHSKINIFFYDSTEIAKNIVSNVWNHQQGSKLNLFVFFGP